MTYIDRCWGLTNKQTKKHNYQLIVLFVILLFFAIFNIDFKCSEHRRSIRVVNNNNLIICTKNAWGSNSCAEHKFHILVKSRRSSALVIHSFQLIILLLYFKPSVLQLVLLFASRSSFFSVRVSFVKTSPYIVFFSRFRLLSISYLSLILRCL